MMKTMRLSKSQYVRGVQCQKSLWLYRHRRDLLPKASPSLQMIFDQGHAIGELAHARFGGGRLIEEDHQNVPQALEATRAAMASGARTLYEAAAIFDDVLIRADIIAKAKGATAWDLIEVKGSTEVKDVYLQDIAIQKYVLEGAGLPLRKTVLMHVNNRYVRRGKIEPDEFFTLADVTKDVKDLARAVPATVKSFHKILKMRTAPVVKIGPHCSNPYDCEFQEHCWRHIPDYSVFDLAYAKEKTIAALRDRGVLTIKDIPEDFPLSKNQEIQVAVEKSGKPHIDRKEIAKALNEVRFPLYFLDFETVNPAIPPFDGLRPFQQLPFQASIHVMRKAGGDIEHLEYLGDGKIDPRPGLAAMLAKTIGPKGSVVAYNAGFEGMCLEELASAFPKFAQRLLSAKRRLWDLAGPFRGGHYVHPDFQGSWSIKIVLPTLVPGMSYKNLGIQDGGQAQIAFLALMHGNLGQAEAAKIAQNLKIYCGQDTMAMVQLMRHLRRVVA